MAVFVMKHLVEQAADPWYTGDPNHFFTRLNLSFFYFCPKY